MASMARRVGAVVAAIVVLQGGGLATPGVVQAADPDGGPVTVWDRVFGTDRLDIGRAVAALPDGTIVTAGSTWGTLGEASAIGEDAFIRTYSSDGDVGWTRQFGTSSGDDITAMVASAAGRIFVAGSTGGALSGQTSSGYQDAFLRAYDADGNVVWTRQYGSEYDDRATGVALGGDGNLAVVGPTQVFQPSDPDYGRDDILLRSYTSGGALRWEKILGVEPYRESPAVAVGADGSVYVVTTVFDYDSDVGGQAAVLTAFTSAGDPAWSHKITSGYVSSALAVAVDSTGRVLVGGVWDDYDVFLRSYAADGSLGWSRTFGIGDEQWVSGVAVDPADDIFISGASADFESGTNWVRGYAPDGTFRWERETDGGTASIGADASGDAIAIGARTRDAFVTKFGPTPPTAKVTALPGTVLATSMPVSWTGLPAMSPITGYDVRYRSAPWNGAFGAYTDWFTGTTETSGTLALTAGSTMCVTARAHDQAGLVSGWTSESCTVVPLDDRALTRSSGWTAGTGSGYYAGTYLKTTTAGAKLTRTGVAARRISIVATTCPTCGTVKVYWGSTLLKTVSLYSATTVNKKVIAITIFSAAKTGTLVIKVTSSGKKVLIDGVGLRRN